MSVADLPSAALRSHEIHRQAGLEEHAKHLYHSLDPHAWGPVPVLRTITEDTAESARTYSQLISAVTALELSTHPDLHKKQKAPVAKRANRLLRTLAETTTTFDQATRFARLEDYGRLAQHGLHPSTLAHYERRNTQRFSLLLGLLAERDTGMQFAGGQMQGITQEEAVVAIIQSIGREGLVAHTSLPRQDGNERLVDGKKYRWDVTVESDGRLIPEGRYLVQAKSAPVLAKYFEYHSDIVVVSAYEPTLYSRFMNPIGGYIALHNVLDGTAESAEARTVKLMQEQVLRALSDKGPAQEDMVLIA